MLMRLLQPHRLYHHPRSLMLLRYLHHPAMRQLCLHQPHCHLVRAVLTPPQSTQNAIAASALPSPRRNFMQHSYASRAKRIIMGVILIIPVCVFLVILYLFCAALCYKFGYDVPIWL